MNIIQNTVHTQITKRSQQKQKKNSILKQIDLNVFSQTKRSTIIDSHIVWLMEDKIKLKIEKRKNSCIILLLFLFCVRLRAIDVSYFGLIVVCVWVLAVLCMLFVCLYGFFLFVFLMLFFSFKESKHSVCIIICV